MVAGSSTGLHHDYHDNLYVLLRGKKRFRLYPPSLADRMYVHGQLQRVHPNGRIVHKSQVGLCWVGGGLLAWDTRVCCKTGCKTRQALLSA